MNIGDAVAFIRDHHWAILATTRGDGQPQLSPVIATADREGRVIISSRETAMKVKNLRRAPYASLCVFTERFFGEWVQVEGPVEIVSLPEAMDLLIDYFQLISGEHPDWDDYRTAMEREKRVLVRMAVERAGPTMSG